MRKMTRKQLLFATCLALLAMLFATVVGARPLGMDTSPNEVKAAEPLIIKFAYTDPGGENNSMDPLNQPSGENHVMVNMSYNRLADLTSNFEVVPELAERWESNEDATEWTFYLRKGVKFHDGHELTSEDVVYTFKRVLDPKRAGDDTVAGSEGASQLAFLNYDGIIAADRYVVKFKLDAPAAELPLMISIKNTWIVPAGAKGADLRTSGNGTGPFIPVDFKPVDSPHRFVKFKDYWEEGLPLADEIHLYPLVEAATRAQAIKSGEMDFVQIIDFANIAELENDPNVTLLKSGPSTSMLGIMWVDTPPFDDNRIRQVFKMIYSKREVVDVCWLGYGVIGDDNPINPQMPYAWRPEEEVPIGPDYETARKLLAEAGYGPDNPLKVEFYVSEQFPGFTCFAQLLQQGAKEVGIDFQIITSPVQEYWDNVWLKVPFMMSAHVQRPPFSGLSISHACNSLYPETHWCKPEYDELLLKASRTLDPDERLALYRKAMRWITEEGGDIFEGKFFTVAAARSNCTGYVPDVQISRFDVRRVTCKR
jgi:peptide/nickel transport system substrate-binding protein